MYKTLLISDVHLGTKDSKTEELLDILTNTNVLSKNLTISFNIYC
jgi:UDP-2,3-diacylglucosamine pyrophosphatase LpxH